MVGWGRIHYLQRKELSSTLEVTNFYDKQWNVHCHGLSKNKQQIVKVV
jgi:hypothetical protein